MSKIALEGNASGTGTLTIASQNTNSNYTLTLPNSTGTIVVTGGAQTIEFAAGSASAPSITTTGDTNTGIFFPAADTIAFTEGGAEAMRIDSSGNVGIGTTSPSFAVDVVRSGGDAQLRLMSQATGTNGIIFRNNAAPTSGKGAILYPNGSSASGADTMQFVVDNAERMRIDSSGNVGIGKTSPAAKLDIVGGSDILGLTNTSASGYEAINMTVGTQTARILLTGQSFGDANYGTGDLTIQAQTSGKGIRFGTSGGINQMFLNSSGNLGIGTTSPRAKLSVTNGTENTSGDAPQEVIFTGANQAITAGLGILTVQSNTAIAADVGATIALGGRIRNTGTSTDASNFAVLKGAKENATSDNSAGYFAISTKPNALAPVERMRITSTGRFCINTTYSDTQLNIAYDGGAIRGVDINNTISSNQDAIYFRTNGTNVGRINTDASNTSYVTSSDYRLKENVLPMTGALEKLAQLKPCTWTWKVNGAVGQGFIAHELQEVCPNAVVGEKDAIEIQRVEISPAVEATYDEDGNELTSAVEAVYEEYEVPKYQGVDTSFLVATLTAAIQELKAITDAQATRIEALEAEVAALKGQ